MWKPSCSAYLHMYTMTQYSTSNGLWPQDVLVSSTPPVQDKISCSIDGRQQPFHQQKYQQHHENHEHGQTQQLCHTPPSLGITICPSHLPHTTTQPCHGRKEYRPIFNAAEWPTVDAMPINLMISTREGTEMDCAFGLVLVRLLAHILNLHIIFPKQDVALHAKDVKSCF